MVLDLSSAASRLSGKGSDPLPGTGQLADSVEETGGLTPVPTASTSLDKGPAALARTRFRIRFEKAGELRFVSHHDLMHCFERMFRRASLHVCATQGFNPRPRMVFAQSLALGIVGRAEVLDLELDESLSAEEVHERLARQAPPGLAILSTRMIDPKVRVQVRRAFYRVTLPATRCDDLSRRIQETLAAPNLLIERTRPQPRRIDLRPYICEIHIDGDALEMALWVTPTGAARPEEILVLLGLADLLAAGAVIERSRLELHDEVSAGDEAGANVAPPPVRLPPEHFSTTEPSNGTRPGPKPRAEVEPPPRPTSLFPGPLSFDS